MIDTDDYRKDIAYEFITALNEYARNNPTFEREILQVCEILKQFPFEVECDNEDEDNDTIERDPESGINYDHDITFCTFRAHSYFPVGHYEIFVKAECEVVEDYCWETDDTDTELTVGEVHICVSLAEEF